jgi:hypothetical protein
LEETFSVSLFSFFKEEKKKMFRLITNTNIERIHQQIIQKIPHFNFKIKKERGQIGSPNTQLFWLLIFALSQRPINTTCLSANNKCHLFVSDKKDASCLSATIVMCHLLVGD